MSLLRRYIREALISESANLKKLNEIIEECCIRYCLKEGIISIPSNPKNYIVVEGRWLIRKSLLAERKSDTLATIDQARKSSNYWTPGKCGDFEHTYGSISTNLKHGRGMDHIEKYLDDDEGEAYWRWYGSCAKGVDKFQWLQADMIAGAGGAIVDLTKAAGKGLYRILKPAVKKAGRLALNVADEAGKLALKSTGKALGIAWDVIKDVVTDSADATWDWMKTRGTKKDLTTLAYENPDKFIEFHNTTKGRLRGAGLPVDSAGETASTMGLLQTDIGKQTAETAASSLGITASQLEDLLIVHMHTFNELTLAKKRTAFT